MIHVNDIDLQKTKEKFQENKLVNTWCIDSFFFELLSEATENIGPHERLKQKDEYRMLDLDHGFLEYKTMAVDTTCKTYYPGGEFTGYLVPHEETITIAKSLEIVENEKNVYRPSVMFIYSPCDIAKKYLETSKVNDYPNPDPMKPLDTENNDGKTIVRGHVYPSQSEIVYRENIEEGTEYVGVLLLGESFDPVWVGNRIELSYLYKDKKHSYWQTPTITPVAMSALSALCWMIKHQNQGGIYFPDDIPDYHTIVKGPRNTSQKQFIKRLRKTQLKINWGFIYRTFNPKTFLRIPKKKNNHIDYSFFGSMATATTAASTASTTVEGTTTRMVTSRNRRSMVSTGTERMSKMDETSRIVVTIAKHWTSTDIRSLNF